ncbi:DNA polymerase III subunit gamma/tau [Desulfohalovibrio reitneri]|uniref:DNA polymerase III subunit gamma/tau n=1 Tax=Desulfohalovibrio reitneri TaxID=1307759 RepID=UPI000A8C40A7|nr:DNA polymerase III subunit gamma/tau [Desulfohalovibrio reitneri]
MSSQSLTAKYRPQTFADVVGQEAVRNVLSRATAADAVAPAYLFSGTRGVGKTTLARILAKALNCQTAPTAEPCNQCSHCRQVMAGSAVDVVEIDAASNRGIEDARRLKEDIGYAPIQGRYKVFIVDEAHMLTNEAFNSLLKTLEEPPPHACFVLATTEPHKFPATIISRCQHFTFKRLLQGALEEHLSGLLSREGVEYEEEAVRLIARRGAGSVRDAMSLLSQGLALGGERLTAADIRGVLGLAGKEVFFAVVDAVAKGDCPALAGLLRQVLDQGLDLGFFLRELASCWRDMFLLGQGGDQAAELLDMPAEELEEWKKRAAALSPGHVHACWQLTLEGQRRVLTSLEPAQALELLLFNMASMPRLLDLSGPGAGERGPDRVAGKARGRADSRRPVGNPPGRRTPALQALPPHLRRRPGNRLPARRQPPRQPPSPRRNRPSLRNPSVSAPGRGPSPRARSLPRRRPTWTRSRPWLPLRARRSGRPRRRLRRHRRGRKGREAGSRPERPTGSFMRKSRSIPPSSTS